MRPDSRKNDQMRKVTIKKNFIKHPDGSCLITFGDTQVICTAMIENSVPPFLARQGRGWVTAEYGMLPASAGNRIRRDKTAGRTVEIQRLIGRSLRAVIDFEKLGERTIVIDCDVIQADGGTRTAAITGGFVALGLAVKKALKDKRLSVNPVKDYIAAVSVGVYQGDAVLDLNYAEDSEAETDMNVVMVGAGNFVEVQGTAEGEPFSKRQLTELLGLAESGINELIAMQKKIIGELHG